MVASVYSGPCSDNALPVCLGSGNPNRLVSLWDIVNQFRLGDFLNCHGVLMGWTLMLEGEKARKGAGAHLDKKRFDLLLEHIQKMQDFCRLVGFKDAEEKITRTLRHYKVPESIDLSALQNEVGNVCESVIVGARKHLYLLVARDRTGYVDNPALFGDGVAQSFPSAARDITEAGNCLAAECGTATVFHLMRAAEVALRALAADRIVSYPDAALSSKQVGDLLSALDGKLADMRKADSSLWPTKDVKDAQIRFYHAAVAEFRDFNEAWRRHMAHAHEEAFYDGFQALSIFNHVKGCMATLAEKISETVVTPLYWTAV
jgi:hypothetical protein